MTPTDPPSPERSPGGTEDVARTARDLVRRAGRAVLSTVAAGDGWPFGSLVLTGCTHEGEPLLMLSDLAEHARNLAADPRASLLFAPAAGEEALAEARVSVLGRLVAIESAPERARYVARNPSAAAYADFRDFRLYRMMVERAHLVAGFGRIRWLEHDKVVGPPAPALAESEAGIVAHMNEDHADAVALYATRLLGLAPGPWRMTGIDPEGIDLAATGMSARLSFGARIEDAKAARAELVRLVGEARGTIADGA